MELPRKPATSPHPILPAITERWSPLAFSDTFVEPGKIHTFLEAARWAPSSYNEQPWRYIYACKGDNGRTTLEGLLLPGNSWAKHAGVLVISFAKRTFARNGQENRHALHDLGCASGYLALQLAELGLIGHQMAGFDTERAHTALHVPDDYLPGTMMAIGYPSDPGHLPDELRQRQEAARTRMPRENFAYRGKWKA